MQNKQRRLLIGAGLLVLSMVVAWIAWTGTPSYSLYRIRRALLTHDYATFSRYVDVESVLDHGVTAFAQEQPQDSAEPAPRGMLGKLLKKGILKGLGSDARDLMRAGMSIAVEHAVRDPNRSLPEIPLFAVVAALWSGHAENGDIRFPIKVKKDVFVEVKTRQSPGGVWRVVEVENLPALLPTLKPRRGKRLPSANE
jgi:hypothetical protein